MLPFLEAKKISTVIRSKNGKSVETSSEDEAGEEMHPDYKNAILDLMHAQEQKSVHGIAKAYDAMFEHKIAMRDKQDE
jgi:hypothetical protein